MVNIIQNQDDWTRVLKEVGTFDFYHTYEYHSTMAKPGEEPILVHYKEKGSSIVFPFIKRPIPNSEFFDLTSVHGYLGPVSKIDSTTFNNDELSTQLNKLFVEKNIVSAFSKLNPFVPHQDLVLSGLGSVEQVGELIYIDLTTDMALQRSAYRKSLKSKVNQLRRLFTIKEAENQEEIEIFIDIYFETMNRVSAQNRFLFDKAYFDCLTKSENFEAKILLAICNSTGEYAAGSLSTITNGIVQGELLGTRDKFLPLSPAKLLFDEIRVVGNELNLKYLNYGGGSGGREGSLYQFKSGFSKNHMPFKVWKYITNQEVYDHLAAQKKDVENSSFFPLYRA